MELWLIVFLVILIVFVIFVSTRFLTKFIQSIFKFIFRNNPYVRRQEKMEAMNRGICPKCDLKLKKDDLYCPNCRTKTKSYCSRCGSKLTKDKCPGCDKNK